jgi:hypothetical protein
VNSSEIQTRGRRIASMRDAPEEMAIEQRELMLDVLRHIASGGPGALELSQEVLEVLEEPS